MEAKHCGESLRVWTASITDRAGKPYTVYNGAFPPYSKQLLALSKQKQILKQTPRDAAERFTDKESMERWYEKTPKEMYFLVEPDGEEVCGVIWHASAPAYYGGREYPYGFAIRIYERAAGRGLAKPFMSAAVRDLVARRPDATRGIWLDTDIDNTAARGLYESFGYEEVQRDNKRIHMVLSPERISEICRPGA